MNYKPLRLYLNEEILTSNEQYSYRDIILFFDKDYNNNIIYAEIPYSQGIDFVFIDKLGQEYTILKNKNNDLDLLHFLRNIDNLYAQFVFEQLIYQLINRYNKKVEINGFISFVDDENLLKKVSYYKSNGIKTIKVKLGRENFDDDLRIIQFIFDLFPDINFRFDVNGQWKNIDIASKNIECLLKYPFEYIEDPVKDVVQLEYLNRLYPNKIAIDEPIRNKEILINVLDNYNFSYIVVKPFFIGGIETFLKLKDSYSHTKFIVSSYYETNVGLNYLLNIASIFPDNIHGLGTFNFYKEEIINNLRIEKGYLTNY